jgi:hypothetical protein
LRRSDPELIPKAGLSSDCRLKPACMKAELLVTAGQHTAVNTFPGLALTARHTTRVWCSRSRWPNPQGTEVPKECPVRGVKS